MLTQLPVELLEMVARDCTPQEYTRLLGICTSLRCELTPLYPRFVESHLENLKSLSHLESGQRRVIIEIHLCDAEHVFTECKVETTCAAFANIARSAARRLKTFTPEVLSAREVTGHPRITQANGVFYEGFSAEWLEHFFHLDKGSYLVDLKPAEKKVLRRSRFHSY